jgi:hypothetical protein
VQLRRARPAARRRRSRRGRDRRSAAVLRHARSAPGRRAVSPMWRDGGRGTRDGW